VEAGFVEDDIVGDEDSIVVVYNNVVTGALITVKKCLTHTLETWV
jgi:hypothetical protein